MTSSHSQIHGGLHPHGKPRPEQPGAGNQESPPPMEHPGASHHYADTRAEIPRNFHAGREGTSRMRRLCSLFGKVARNSKKRPVAKSQIHSRSTCVETTLLCRQDTRCWLRVHSSLPHPSHSTLPSQGPLRLGQMRRRQNFWDFPGCPVVRTLYFSPLRASV